MVPVPVFIGGDLLAGSLQLCSERGESLRADAQQASNLALRSFSLKENTLSDENSSSNKRCPQKITGINDLPALINYVGFY